MIKFGSEVKLLPHFFAIHTYTAKALDIKYKEEILSQHHDRGTYYYLIEIKSTINDCKIKTWVKESELEVIKTGPSGLINKDD